jgi:beta-N-acetylhexosaminidase
MMPPASLGLRSLPRPKAAAMKTAMQHAPLMIDIAGTRLQAVDRLRLRHPLVGGLILFGRNWENRAQLTQLCASVKRLRPDLLIAVDHEGGRVQRFRNDGFVHLPPMRVLGEIFLAAPRAGHKAGPLAASRAALACGYVMGAQLRACGVDMSFAPVLDLDYGASSVIGNRAFSDDARTVSLLAQSLMQGMAQTGLAHCAKHFPGHGYAQADSHLAVPLDKRSLRSILAKDAAPYATLDLVLQAVMPAHVVYPKVDSLPAGFSTIWLQKVLRQSLGFSGAVFSDDLSMAGAREVQGREISATQAVLAALQAGCDMALLCNQSLVGKPGHSPLDTVLAELSQAQSAGLYQPKPESHARRLALLPKSPSLDWAGMLQSAAYQRAVAALP